RSEACDSEPSLRHVRDLSERFGNTMTSTLWRFIEQGHNGRPMVALVTRHPHPAKRKPNFDPLNPCRYCVQSPAFAQRFGGLGEVDLFRVVASYAGAQRGVSLGAKEVLLSDAASERHLFRFETFFNGH
ncbi:DUF955 domain-containing protein, partial [Neisseria gonorrhoeae]